MEDVMRLVSTGDCVKIWDAVSMATLEQFNPHSSSHPIAQACWSSNNQYLVSASSIGDKLVVSSLKSSPVPVVELAEGKKQTRVCLSSSSQFVVSGGLDCCIHIWDLKTKRLHRTLEDHKEEVTCVSFNANDSHIASGSTSGDLILHSLITNVSSKPFGHGSNQPIHDLRLSMLRRSLLGSVSDSGAVVLWDSNTQKEIHVFESAHKAPGSGLSFSPASELVVSVGLDKKIVCYDTASKIVVRSIRVDSPLTAVDFTLDGTGLVVGSTQGKIYQYDLRNSSAPTKVTAAHKTSVTSLRFQSGVRQKSSKTSSAKVSSSKKSSSKLSSSNHPEPSPQRELTTGGAAKDPISREAEGQQTPQSLPVTEMFNNIGRNSLDIFSPAREDSRTLGVNGDTPLGRTNVTNFEMLSKEGEGQKVRGRASLDIFSPVREDLHSGSNSFRKTPLGTPVGSSQVGTPLMASAGRYNPLHNTFMTPPPIKEEELTHNAPDLKESKKFDKGSASSLETEAQTTPTSLTQPTNHSEQPKSTFFTPEANWRRGDSVQTQLTYGSPVQPETQTTTTAAAAGPALSAAMSSTLTQNIAETASQNGAPFTSLQMHFIQNMIHETLEDFRDACHKDIINLQVEMVRQFCIQLNEIHNLIENYSVNEALVEEVQKLKEENQKLRSNY
ncbi:protein NEDD1 isoform X2 [Boleophthalmus pectinirostris]|uniref:protein NEDD1 isoform X2 n=1 Tax=Boleophthalmus pectinirostris TaxID=150288 RepID=UPI0024308F9E|nr:protein NEDD1 isoform X2 [Boleophthalmus pectinirostris]